MAKYIVYDNFTSKKLFLLIVGMFFMISIIFKCVCPYSLVSGWGQGWSRIVSGGRIWSGIGKDWLGWLDSVLVGSGLIEVVHKGSGPILVRSELIECGKWWPSLVGVGSEMAKRGRVQFE